MQPTPTPGTVLCPVGGSHPYGYRLTVVSTQLLDGISMTRCQHHRWDEQTDTTQPATINGDLWLDGLMPTGPGRWACPSDDPDEGDPNYYEACSDSAPGQLQLF